MAARNTRLQLGGRACAPHRSHREIPSNRRRSKAANNASPRSHTSRSPKRTCAWEHRRAHMQGTHARHTCPPHLQTHAHALARAHTHMHTRAHARTQNTCVARPAGGCAPSALPETSRTTAQCPHCLGSSLARARNAPPHPHRPDACKRGSTRGMQSSRVRSALCTTAHLAHVAEEERVYRRGDAFAVALDGAA